MSQYPTEIYTPRTIENKSGVVYDPLKKTVIYAEDYQSPAAEIVAIQETLGIEPMGVYETVKAWLSDLASEISMLWEDKEDLANKVTGFMDDSEDHYPSTHTVKLAFATAQWGYPFIAYTPGGSATDMAASSAYYFGTQLNYYATTSANINRIYVPRGGLITDVMITIRTGSVGSSGENGTLYLRKNGTTDYALGTFSLATPNAIYRLQPGMLNIPINSGDYFEFKFATPAWSTLPKIPGMHCIAHLIQPY